MFKKSNDLNDKRTYPKVYWTVSNNFLHNIKIPSVPPVFIYGETITNIVGEVNILNDFFCFPVYFSMENSSKLPSLLMTRLNSFH